MQAEKLRRPWKPLIAVDFDGVLHHYNEIGAPGRVTGGAVKGSMQWLADLYIDGRFNVAIYSARSRYLRGRWAMKGWLADQLVWAFPNEVDPHSMFTGDLLCEGILSWIKWPWFKPGAFVYLDDRAWRFDGHNTWPYAEELLSFKPWNKRSPT